MGKSLQELIARVDNLRTDIEFIQKSYDFRPHVYKVLNRNGNPDSVVLAERFAQLKDTQAENIYGPLLVRLVAALERYLRGFLQEAVTAWVSKAKTFDRLPRSLINRNIILSGKLMANSDSPRDHISIDIPSLIRNLATCRGSSNDFQINLEAFSTLISGITPEMLESSFRTIKVEEWWNAVCSEPTLVKLAGSKKTTDVTKYAQRRLKDLSRWRNNWAHGGDEEIVLSAMELSNACDFVASFARSFDTTILKRISAATLE